MIARFFAAAALAAVLAATVVVVVDAARTSRAPAGNGNASHKSVQRLPPYWTVRPGDTLTEIARKTGLTVAQLETFNPSANPVNLTPGQRLNLWAHPPKPHRKPPGPRFWTVRPGDSFGLIAAKTGINITKLEELNPDLKPATLRPGDQVKLRP